MPNGATVPGTGFGRGADSAQCVLLLPNCRDDGLGQDPWLVCVVVRDSRLPSITPVSALPVGRQSHDLECRKQIETGAALSADQVHSRRCDIEYMPFALLVYGRSENCSLKLARNH